MSTRAISLRSLLAGVAEAPEIVVRGLKLDGRTLEPGEAFVAVPGLKSHGLEFVSQALERGARAVLWEPAPGMTLPALPPGVVAVAIPGLRARLGEIADRCHGSPSLALSIAGVTGTNGKTTSAWLLAHAATQLGRPTAYAGTLGYGVPPALHPTSHTTPDVLSVHRQLGELAAGGAKQVAMEVSSHALDQGRMDGVRVAVAAFTNLTRDHLDYHGTMEAYAAAKQRLFLLPGLRDAVINTDDAAGRRFAAALPATLRLTTVGAGTEPGIEGARRLQITSVTPTAGGLTLGIDGSWGRAQVESPLVGSFNAENLAVVLGVLLAWGFPLDRAAGALAGCNAPPGRMEAFRSRGGVVAIVDYAHTPDALEKVLAAARAHCTGRLSVVFGCGGDRDRGKRPLMGAIAERLADGVLVTDDNPRTEDGDAIVAGILAGMREPARARVIRDREAAITEAVEDARGGDVVVVAGKGHEDYQLVGSERRAYSDRDVARRLAEALP